MSLYLTVSETHWLAKKCSPSSYRRWSFGASWKHLALQLKHAQVDMCGGRGGVDVSHHLQSLQDVLVLLLPVASHQSVRVTVRWQDAWRKVGVRENPAVNKDNYLTVFCLKKNDFLLSCPKHRRLLIKWNCCQNLFFLKWNCDKIAVQSKHQATNIKRNQLHYTQISMKLGNSYKIWQEMTTISASLSNIGYLYVLQ